MILFLESHSQPEKKNHPGDTLQLTDADPSCQYCKKTIDKILL